VIWTTNAMSPGKDTVEWMQLRNQVEELEAELLRQKNLVQASESRFRVLADAAPVMIWMSGVDGMYTFFNRTWLEYRGRTIAQELGNGWMEGIHPEDRENCLETYLRHYSARVPFHVQYRLRSADGEYRWFEDAGTPMCGAADEYVGFMGLGVDITDRKRGGIQPDPDAVRMVFALTERERQVLVLIAAGKSTKETAVALGISYKTADSHRSRILEKLGVHETASMVRYAIRAGLIAP
jgi:PAS domain S-box-containing protein